MLDLQDCTELHLRQAIMAHKSYKDKLLDTPAKLLELWQCHEASESVMTTPMTTIIMAFVFVIGLLVLALLFLRRLQQQHRHQKESTKQEYTKPKLQRSVSNTSAMLAACTLPESVNQPDPIINIYVEFEDQCPSELDIMKHLVQKLLGYERMAKIPVLDKKEQLSFEDFPYDARQLIRRIPLEASDNDTHLYHMIQAHLHDPLNAPKVRGQLPWWEILLLENKGLGHSGILIRIHHALGDGISLATVAQQILEYADGTPFTSVIPRGMIEKRASAPHTKLTWYRTFWKLCEATVQVFAMPLVTPDHDTLFSKGMQPDMVHSHNRKIVLFPTFPLEFIKAIKNVANVSINDVLFTCLSQAIRDYLEELECPVLREQGANLLCRALIAAVLPRSIDTSTAETLQNKWFFLSSDLGVGVSPDNNDILERLEYLHEHLGSLKTSPVPMVGLWIQNYFMRYVTTRWFNATSNLNCLVRRSLSISNVPGPPKVCLFAKQPASSLNMFLSNIMPHATFLSYAGSISGNITVDPVTIPHAQALSKHLKNAVVTLAHRLDVPVPEELRTQ